MNPPRRFVLPLAPLILLIGAAFEAAATPGWEAGFGVGYLKPSSDELSRLYDGSASIHLSAARRIAEPAGSIALEVGYSRSTAVPAIPFFVSAAEAELQWIPIDLVARLELARQRRLAPFLGIGFRLLYAKERFEYSIAGETRNQNPAERWDPGVLIVAGFDHALPPRLRIEGFFSVVFAERRISVDDSDYAITGDDGFDAGSLGLRISWRLP